MKNTIIIMIAVLLLVVSCTAPQQQKVMENTAEESASTGQRSVVPVTVENFAFSPTDVEITVGSTVEWSNKDGMGHTVTFDTLDVDEQLPAGGSVTHTFTQAGEYTYHCSIHSSMQGKVIVR